VASRALKIIIYFEVLVYFVYAFLPWDYGDFRESITLITMVANFILVGADLKGSIIASTLSVIITELVIMYITQKQSYTVIGVVSSLLNTVFCFCICTTLGAMIVYMAQLRAKLAALIQENVNLFDKMHEGIIVVDKADLSLKFASKPAVGLVKQLPDSEVSCA